MTSVVPGASQQVPAREALYEKLRPGPGLSAEQVIANQRARLCGAMVELVAERGYGGVTVRALSALAGVSTKTFYGCFSNVEDCFVTTYTRILHDALRRASEASSGGPDSLRTRIAAFFTAIEAEPKAARLVLVESRSTGPTLAQRARLADRALERFIGNELASVSGRAYPAGLVHGAGAAALRLVRSRLVAGGSAEISAMADDFSRWLLSITDRHFGQVAGKESIAQLDPQSAPETGIHIGNDRRCLLAAVAKLSVRDGYEALTVPAIRREAGVSRRSFDESFDGIEDCFLAAIEDRIAKAVERAAQNAGGAASWERSAVRAIATPLDQLSRDPLLAQLVLVEILEAGRAGFELRERMISRWAHCLHRTVPVHLRSSEMGAEASVAAAIAIAHAEVAAGRLARLRRIAPGAAFLFLAPTIGSVAAARSIGAELRTLPAVHGVRKHSTESS